MLACNQRVRCPKSQSSGRVRMECPTSQRTRLWANAGLVARLPMWHSVASCDGIAEPPADGSYLKNDRPQGQRE